MTRTSNKRGKKSSPSVRAKKSTPRSKQVAPLPSDVEENGAFGLGVQSNIVEENKDIGSLPCTAMEEQATLQEFVKSTEQAPEGEEVLRQSANEVMEIKSSSNALPESKTEIEEQNADGKEIIEEPEVLMTKPPDIEEVSPSCNEQNVVIREEISATAVVVEGTKVVEEAVEEKKPDDMPENPHGSSLEDVKRTEISEEEPKEISAEQNGSGVHGESDGVREEVTVTTVVVEGTKVTEEAVEEKKLDDLSENPPGSSLEDVNKMGISEEEPKEISTEQDGGGVHSESNGVLRDSNKGSTRDVVEKENAAGKIEERAVAHDSSGDIEGNNMDSDSEMSENDDEDNEENGDSSLYVQSSLTDRKKQKDFEIFVGGLDKEAVEEDLIEVFGKYGEIQAARIVKHPNTKKSRGFGFVRYASAELARKALAELKDGTEVRGKHVGISASQDNDTLYMGNICKTWTKEHVLEVLKSFGIEQIEEIYLPDDPKKEGKSKGFALLEFSTHSDAMAAFQRLRKPDAIFGCDRSAKVAFAQTPMHPGEEALLQVKTVYIEGLTGSWDEGKVKDICGQYGEIEKVQLSRNLVTKRDDFGFVAFNSRESAVACVEGINNAQIEGNIKIKAELAKPHHKGRLQKRGARGGFKVKEGEKIDEAGLSKAKGHAKPKRHGKKGKALSKLKSGKRGESHKLQSSFVEGEVAGAPCRSERTNVQRKELPGKATKRGRRDMVSGSSKRPSKKPRVSTHSKARNHFGNQGNHSRFITPQPNYTEASVAYNNPYSHGYPASVSSYQGHVYGSVSGSRRSYSDMEPHAGYIQPAAEKRGRNLYGYGRSSGGYDVQGGSVTAYGRGPALPPSSIPNLTSYARYEERGRVGGVYYPSSSAYPPYPPHRTYH